MSMPDKIYVGRDFGSKQGEWVETITSRYEFEEMDTADYIKLSIHNELKSKVRELIEAVEEWHITEENSNRCYPKMSKAKDALREIINE